MKNILNIKVILLAVIIICITGCQKNFNGNEEQKAINYTDEIKKIDTEEPIVDLTIAQANIELPHIGKCLLELQMYEGFYYIEKDVGPFEGDNWYGNCKLILSQDKKIINEYLLAKEWNEGMRFQDKFEILIHDYDKDGKVEFLIGQYLSSNINEYKLYRIDSNRIILVDGDNYFNISGKEKYSCLFDFNDNGEIYYQYYDNSEGKMIKRVVDFIDGSVIKKEYLKS